MRDGLWPCPHCDAQFTGAVIHAHVNVCAKNPANRKTCRHCGKQKVGRTYSGMCGACYRYEQRHGIPRPEKLFGVDGRKMPRDQQQEITRRALAEYEDRIDAEMERTIKDARVRRMEAQRLEVPDGIAAIEGWRILGRWTGRRWKAAYAQQVMLLR